ncbi:amidohydrolase family protein [Planctomycetota bacterium]
MKNLSIQMIIRTNILGLIVMLLLFHSPHGAGQSEFDAPVAICNATIVTEPGQTINNGSVLMQDSRIVAVGENITIPDHAEIIDGKGLVVYAGFIDSATHMGVTKKKRSPDEMKRAEDEMPPLNQGPVPYMPMADRSGVRPEFRMRDLYTPTEAGLEKHRQAGFTTALIVPHGGILAGTSALVQLGDKPLRQSVLIDDFGQHAGFDSGEEKNWENPDYPGTIMGAMAQFRQTMIDVDWYAGMKAYCKKHPIYRPQVFSDPSLESLPPVLSGEMPLIFHAGDENAMWRAFKLAGEFNANLVLAGAKEAWRITENIKTNNIPLIVSIKFPEEPYPKKKPKKKQEEETEKPTLDLDKEWEKLHFEPKGLRDERRREWQEYVANTSVLDKAGIRFVLGSWELKEPGDFLGALRQAIKEGLSVDTALGALTTEPAKLFGMEASLGRVAENKLANLTVMTAPFENEKAKVAYVFIEGKKFKSDTDKEEEEKKDENTAEEDNGEWPEFAFETEADRQVKIETNGNILLKNATVLTIVKGRLEDTSVLVQNGKITQIGKELSAPEGTLTVDLTGYFVMPGIIDPHSHVGTTGGLNEWTMSVTPEVRANDIVNHKDIGFHRALAGGVTTIHTMHGSANTIGGQNVILRLKYLTTAKDMLFPNVTRTVKFALGENVTQKNWQAARGKRFPNSRMGVELTMRKSFQQAKKYKAARDRYEEARQAGRDVPAFRYDLRLEALVEIMAGQLWVHAHCYRADEILRLLQVAEDNGFRIGVLQHTLESYRVMPEIARHGCAVSTFSDWWSYKIEALNAIPHNAGMMSRYGVSATVNSDSREVGRHLNLEAAKIIRFTGIDETEALRLITVNAAIQLGIADRVGSIEIGKDADLAVFNGHPFDTFAINVMTLIQGNIYFKHRDFDLESPAKPKAGMVAFPAPPEPIDITNSKAGKYAIVNATVHPVSGPAIEKGIVVIKDGRIKAVGRDIEFDTDTVIVQAEGCHVYPGLINAATSLGIVGIGSVSGTMDHSEIGKFTPHIRASSAVDPHNVHLKVTRAEGVTTALTIPGGGVVSGEACLLHMDGWSMPEMLIEDGVALVVNLPSLPIVFNPEAMKKEEEQKEKRKIHFENIEEIHAYFQRAKHYAKARTDDTQNIEPQPDLEAMLPYVNGEKPVIMHANDYKKIMEALRFADKFGLKLIINGGRGAWKVADQLAEKNVPVIVSTTFAFPHRYNTWDNAYRNATLLAKAGVTFCFATQGASLAKLLPLHGGMAVAHGLDIDTAIRAMTLNTAEILGVAGQLGSIEEGKVADLIVTTGNPCQATTRVLAEFIKGRPVNLDSIHEYHYRNFMSRPDPKLPPEQELKGPPSMTRSK